MRFTSAQRLDDGVVEREFTLGEIPGILWTPASGSASEPVPLILLGHPGGLHTMYPRLVARAQNSAAAGFAAATIELPGSGDRPRIAAAEDARADLRRALKAGEPVSSELVDRLILPLMDEAVPEWQATLDGLLSLPEMGGTVGFAGGLISLGTRLAVVEPRTTAAVLFAGSFVPRTMLEEPGRSPFHCSSCCSGTTKATTGRWRSTCSTPSAPRKRRCTPTWAGTPASRGTRRTPAPGSSPGT
ncbi:MAG TPA: alpha/beta hydrolase [Nocardioidaceae bacterium]